MSLFLANLSSAIFGISDFAGGMAARRVSAVTVVFGAHLTGLVGLLVAAPFFGDGAPPLADVGWGVAAGIGGGVGVALLYHGLATTRMSVVAPAAALVGTVVPVLFGVATGERPAPLAWVGMALAVPALLLIPGRSEGTGSASGRALWYGVVVGILFGLFGVLISRTGADSGVWPLLSARAASVPLMAVVAVGMRRPVVPAPGARGLVFVTGVLDATANVLFLLALRIELLSIVAVITALYPASTVALAFFVLGERVNRVQAGGMALAVGAVALIAVA
jgi:drug/metabolite transporter (DMT)-like permease